jgi:hypothetical protein
VRSVIRCLGVGGVAHPISMRPFVDCPRPSVGPVCDRPFQLNILQTVVSSFHVDAAACFGHACK